MANPNVGQVVAAAWQKMVGSEPQDAIFKEYALLAWFESHAQKDAGGRSLIGPIEYKVNSTVKSLASPSEGLDVVNVDIFDESEANWKQYAGVYVMTTMEEALNRGDHAKFALAKGKLNNLRKSMRKEINSDIAGSTAGADLTGLQTLVPDDPTTGTVQGINRATYTFWRSQDTSGAKTTSAYDNLRSAMRTIRTQCAKGQGEKFPTDYWCSAATSNGFEGILIANERVVGKDDKDANAAFSGEHYLFGKARVRWDADIADSRMYALNSEDIKLCYQSGHWFKGYPAVRPANQLQEVFAIETIAQLFLKNARHLGVVDSIS
ncbi:MAG TPA: phage major capsid protein [Vicinamibacterales bacterium]|nr:phage major capsid protein [Vicinamibacterales bacterium]